MALTYWSKQTAERPLFPDMLWSRPETKRQAGKLLVLGGSAHGFAAPAEAYAAASSAGVGLTRVLLPHHVKRLLPRALQDMEFVPDTPSGSFARQALAEVLDAADWADGVLLAGNFGRNSETAVLLEAFITKYSGPVTLTGDAIDYFVDNPKLLLDRERTVVVADFSQLQKLAKGSQSVTAFTSKLDFLHFIEALHNFSTSRPAAIVISHLGTTFVSQDGQVSTTKPISRHSIELASSCAVWQLQNPAKPFAALSCAVL